MGSNKPGIQITRGGEVIMAYDEDFLVTEDIDEGKVVVCTATDCKWNCETKCIADDGVMINFHKDHADCNTYTHNQHIPGQSESAQL